MTIHLHPNKDNPTCYRVYRKIDGKEHQHYFSFSKGKSTAKKLASECDKKLEEQSRALKLRKELPVNKLFDDDGHVKGIKRTCRVREGRRDADLLIARPPGKPAKEISMNCRSFTDAYEIAISYILEQAEIDLTPEIQMMFNRSKKYVLHAKQCV